MKSPAEKRRGRRVRRVLAPSHSGTGSDPPNDRARLLGKSTPTHHAVSESQRRSLARGQRISATEWSFSQRSNVQCFPIERCEEVLFVRRTVPSSASRRDRTGYVSEWCRRSGASVQRHRVKTRYGDGGARHAHGRFRPSCSPQRPALLRRDGAPRRGNCRFAPFFRRVRRLRCVRGCCVEGFELGLIPPNADLGR